jgi:hypothetical protein
MQRVDDADRNDAARTMPGHTSDAQPCDFAGERLTLGVRRGIVVRGGRASEGVASNVSGEHQGGLRPLAHPITGVRSSLLVWIDVERHDRCRPRP